MLIIDCCCLPSHQGNGYLAHEKHDANLVPVVRMSFEANHSERNNMTETSRPRARCLVSLGIYYMILKIPSITFPLTVSLVLKNKHFIDY